MTNEHGFQTIIHSELTFLISPDLYPPIAGNAHLPALYMDLEAVATIARRDGWNLSDPIVMKLMGSSTIVVCGEKQAPLATIRTRHRMYEFTHPLPTIQAPKTGFHRYAGRDMSLAGEIAQKYARTHPSAITATSQPSNKKWRLSAKILACMCVVLCVVVLADVLLYIHSLNP